MIPITSHAPEPSHDQCQSQIDAPGHDSQRLRQRTRRIASPEAAPVPIRGRILEFIEAFCNPSRLHSSLGYLSPVQFETQAPRLSRHNCGIVHSFGSSAEREAHPRGVGRIGLFRLSGFSTRLLKGRCAGVVKGSRISRCTLSRQVAAFRSQELSANGSSVALRVRGVAARHSVGLVSLNRVLARNPIAS